jgi:DNA modification methylase
MTKPAWRNRIVDHGNEPLDAILFNPANWRIHPKQQQDALTGVLSEVGWVQDVIVNRVTGHLVDGHLRCQVAARNGEATIPVVYVDLTPSEEALVLASIDPIAAMAATDKAKLDELMQQVQSDDARVQAMMAGIAEKEGLEYGKKTDEETIEQARTTLAERFIVPPFSVLDARQGYWQDRKRAWIALGIESELGRGGAFSFPDDHIGNDGKFHTGDLHLGDSGDATGATIRPSTLGAIAPNERGENGILSSPGKYANNGLLGISQQARSHYAVPGGAQRDAVRLGDDGHTVRGDGRGREIATSNSSQSRLNALQKTGDSRAVVYGTEGNISEQSGTSIFDPVLCELAYRWFCPKNGIVLDPFAGGSVRGIVASKLGYGYVGIDLRSEQIQANEAQAGKLVPDRMPVWITGDSCNLSALVPGEFDFVFTCPPYFDLELYSDDENDLSNSGDYSVFIQAYNVIIKQAISKLKDNRFACFVVGDIRDKKGFYRNFVSDTIDAFQSVGATLYNEAILITAVGSLPIRTSRMFQSGRKLGKTHQNVLVFYKGDPRKIKEFGDVEAGDIERMNDIKT